MKVTELMIGDLVLVTGELSKIIEIHEHAVLLRGRSFYYGEDEIKPIPLTKEILERNSFLKVESIEYPSNSAGVSFLYRNTPEGLRIFVQNACAGGPTCTMIKTCKYVHEVQHMIKMCDIEKNIVL